MTPRKPTIGLPPVSPLRPGKAAPNATELVEVEKPIYGGNFLARYDGKAIFVPLALPGEQVRIRITDSKSGYSTAELAEIITPVPERINPRCPHFGPCGGCNYQHTDYATQLAFKQAILRETLERAGVSAPAEIATLAADPWAYRNRIRVAFDAAGNPGYRGRRSHAVIPIRECPIAAPLLVSAAKAAAEILARVPANLRPHEVLLFCDPTESALLATFFTAEPTQLRLDSIARALRDCIPALKGAELATGGRPGHPPRALAQWGATSLTYHAAGFDYRVDHGAFFQVNRWLIDAFVANVVLGHSGTDAWDLFAGVGLFARQLTLQFDKVVAVESATASISALAANLAGTGGQAVPMPTLEFLRQNRTGRRPDLIVVDPPRTGLGAEINGVLVEIAAPHLVYVSCDPATLARDLRVLLAGGYTIASITLADLFPQTFHLETVVHLLRA
jgi:23S rRNA (uracil1939-C5)-methyltransferase